MPAEEFEPSPGGLTSPVPFDTLWSEGIVIESIVLVIVNSLIVGLRFLSRRMSSQSYGWDDWTIVIGLFFFYWHSICSILIAVVGGAGHPIHTLSPTVITPHLKIILGSQVAYALTLCAIKTSILILYTRIFGVSKSMRIAVRFLVGLVLAWTIVAIVLGIGLCTPFAKNWDKTITTGHCANATAAGVAVAASETVVNVSMWILPLPKVWALQMRIATKLALSAIFAIGLVDVIMGILRIVAVAKVDFEADWVLVFAQMYFFSELEAGLAILVACAPTLKPLFRSLGWLSPSSRRGPSTPGEYKLSSYSHIVHDERSGKSKAQAVGLAVSPDSSRENVTGHDNEGIKMTRDVTVDEESTDLEIGAARSFPPPSPGREKGGYPFVHAQ